MSSPESFPSAPNHVALCVAAFLTDRRCRRLLRRMLDGTPVLTLEINEKVLEAIGQDPRGWRDWDPAVAEAVRIAASFERRSPARWRRAA